MRSTGSIAAVVLAAGKSSRMGTSKSLLPLGSMTVIERVVQSVSQAAVDDIVVVTGHEPDKILPVLQTLPVRRAHNACYESGMFSSVQTGVAALPPEVEAFFVLPADYPLVRPRVLDRLVNSLQDGGPGILHPCCCGLRGHPPLLSGRYRAALLAAPCESDLRTFLGRCDQDEAEVEVEDLTILMDMDRAEDYARLARFANILDAAPEGRAPAGGGAGAAARAAPSSADALYLLELLEAPDSVIRHCRAVAKVGTTLAEALEPHVPTLDVELVRAACLLHDMARNRPKHALVAQNLLSNLGLGRLGAIVGAHMVLPPEQMETFTVTEEQLLYLADKIVIDDKVAGIEARAQRVLAASGQDPAAEEGARTRMQVAKIIKARVETILGRSLDEVLT